MSSKPSDSSPHPIHKSCCLSHQYSYVLLRVNARTYVVEVSFDLDIGRNDSQHASCSRNLSQFSFINSFHLSTLDPDKVPLDLSKAKLFEVKLLNELTFKSCLLNTLSDLVWGCYFSRVESSIFSDEILARRELRLARR